MKVISYSLFGYNKERQANCFDFASYLRGFMINVRLARLLFPDWKIRLHLDKDTYNGFERFFELLQPPHNDVIQIIICEDAPLTKAMLWRMLPAFDDKVDVFICRDVDSPLTYKDKCCVEEFVNSTKAAHAITDSISHTIPMMGGMIGFKVKHFKDYTGFRHWDLMVNVMSGYEVKGADQDFLNRFIYPKYANPSNSSIMQHYFLGMPNTFLDGYKNTVEQPDNELKDSNYICGHIGAAGHYPPETERFLMRYRDNFEDLRIAELLHKDIFYWINENTI